MSRIYWKPGTLEYPLPAVMVSCGDMEKSNVMTAAWTGIINSDPAMCYVSIRKERYSYNIIKKTGEFVINLTTECLCRKTDWVGVRTGSKIDKFKQMNLTKEKATKVKCPLIAERPINLECKVTQTIDLGTHTMFMANILSVDVDDKYINKNGALDISKCNLIAYANGSYFSLGKRLGTFGYSVRKKK